MKGARERRRILAGKRHAQRIRRAAGLARRQHAADRGLPLRQRALEQPPALGDRARLGAHLAALGFKQRKGSIGLRNRALGIAQGVARFAARVFFSVEFLTERFDAAPQRFEIFFLRRAQDRGGTERD
jgi:hypothetical protein